MKFFTNPPNEFAQRKGAELGLSLKQVNGKNFGFHTIKGIKDEIAKGVDSESVF